MTHPTSVVLIVKDEAEVLERCLRSVLQVADDIVVCDTGSTDATCDIARRYHANVVAMGSVPKPFHFAEARNFATTHAKNDWVLSIDADEVLRPGMARKIRDAMAADPAATALRVTFTDRGFVTHKKKIFDRRVWKWESRVHERLIGGKVENIFSAYDVVMEHLPTPNKKLRRDQNIELLRLAVVENPDYMRLFRHLGQELMLEKKWSEAIPNLATYLEKTTEEAIERSEVMIHLARCYAETDRMEIARTWFGAAAQMAPGRREPHYLDAWYAIKNAKVAPDLAYAMECLNRCLAIDEKQRPGSPLDNAAAWGSEPMKMMRFCKEQVSLAQSPE